MSGTEDELMGDEDHWPLTDSRLRRVRKLPPCFLVAVGLGVLLAVAVVIIIGLSAGVAVERNRLNNAASAGTSSSKIVPVPSSIHPHPAPTSTPGTVHPHPTPSTSHGPAPSPTSTSHGPSPTSTTPSPSSSMPSPTPSPSPSPLTTCTTPECVELSSQILSRLDTSIHPCEDFYSFTCGKFDKSAIIPHGLTSTGTFTSLAEKNIERVRSLLESANASTGGAIAKAAIYYQSCLNTEEVETNALNNLTQLISGLGGWPLVGIERTRPWDINDPDGFLVEKLYGSGAFFEVGTLPDPKNSSRNLLTVAQGGLTLPTAEAYNKTGVIRPILKRVMLEVLSAIDDSIPEANYSSAVEEILKFEETIANFTDFGWLTQTPVHVKLNGSVSNISHLSTLLPSFNWTKALMWLQNEGKFSVNLLAPVLVFAPSRFLTKLDALIKNSSQEVLENYAKWHLVFKLLPALGKDFTDIYFGIQELLHGTLEPPRYQTCVSTVEQHVKFAVARAFKDRFLPPGARENITMILDQLKMALKERISESEWMDNKTRARATDKVNHITDLLAYPEFISNNTALNKFYDRLNISATGYFNNYIGAVRFNTLHMLSALDMFNNRSEWSVTLPYPPTIVNAFYNPTGNNMYVLEGILDEPIFKTYWPTYFKFGTIGFVVGHELVHGFDSHGRFFNQIGDLESWMSSTAEKAFINRTQCLITQYGQYSLRTGRVNGTLTLAENIADNGGVETAFRAYKNFVSNTSEEQQMLPGLPYTPDQLFFIGTAQPWCQIATDTVSNAEEKQEETGYEEGLKQGRLEGRANGFDTGQTKGVELGEEIGYYLGFTETLLEINLDGVQSNAKLKRLDWFHSVTASS